MYWSIIFNYFYLGTIRGVFKLLKSQGPTKWNNNPNQILRITFWFHLHPVHNKIKNKQFEMSK